MHGNKIITALVFLFSLSFVSIDPAFSDQQADSVEQWGLFEASFQGPETGNPFVDVQLTASFHQDNLQPIEATGFYDGQGIYRIRFMPDVPGQWHYETTSNVAELNGKSGQFTATAPSANNHGPVRVRDTFHFAYADGKVYRQIGTTCYAWTCQSDALQEQTLKTLTSAPFNKIRMCVFPKWYIYNKVDPPVWPFEGTPPKNWDFTRPNPAFFKNFEKRIGQLRDLGIEADVILFHPYDEGRWGFDRMGAENDDRYLSYLIARLSAYRNVWWSMANEWDFNRRKKVADWDRLGELVHKSDPYGRLCSIHNGVALFDHGKPWITHVSLQNDRSEDANKYRNQYKKPVIYDECKYEGNISTEWGDITAQRMVGMFWDTLVRGAYCGHGETYLDPNDVLWWSKGGVLHGESPARLAFFKKIVEAAPAATGEPLKQPYCWGVNGEYYLFYLRDRQHAKHPVNLPSNVRFKAEIIDTWEMTVTPLPGEFTGRCEIALPTKPYLAIRLTKIP